MRLALSLPEEWLRSELGGGRYAAFAGSEVAIYCAPPAPLPENEGEWMREIMESDLPDGTTASPHELGIESALGWPMRLFEVQVLDAAGAVVEMRVCAFYHFLEYVAAAAARGGQAPLEGLRDDLLRALVSGRPDWGNDVVAEAQVWEGFEAQQN